MRNRIQEYCDITNRGLRDSNNRLSLPQDDSEVNLMEYGPEVAFIESYRVLGTSETRHYIVLIHKDDIPQVIEFLQGVVDARESKGTVVQSKVLCYDKPTDNNISYPVPERSYHGPHGSL